MSDADEQIKSLVNDVLARELRGQTNSQVVPLFESIEQYQTTSGNRFRMTKDQVTRNLSRQDAFKEFVARISR
jgi:hypothetical protein